MESLSSSAVSAPSGESKKRQKRSIEEKRRIVQESLVPGASIAQTAREHGVNANQVYAWRKQFLVGKLIDKGTNRGSSGSVQRFV